jgi:hypothetical protein
VELDLAPDAARSVCRRAEAGYSVASITRALARDFDVIATASDVWAYLRDHGHERPAVAVMPQIPASPLCYDDPCDDLGNATDADAPPPATIGVGVCDFAPPACPPPAPSNALPMRRKRIRSAESERYRGLPELARFGEREPEDTPDHDRARVGALQRRLETVYAKRYDDVLFPRWVARELYESGEARKTHLIINPRDVCEGAGDDEDFVRAVQHYPPAEHRRLADTMAELLELKYSGGRAGQPPALSPAPPPPAPGAPTPQAAYITGTLARDQLPDGWDALPFAKLVYLAGGKMPPPGVGDGPEDLDAAIRAIDGPDAAAEEPREEDILDEDAEDLDTTAAEDAADWETL